MDTFVARDPQTVDPAPRDLADALLVVGFVLMVLGIYEIGGLVYLAAGFLVLWAGALAALADMRGNRHERRRRSSASPTTCTPVRRTRLTRSGALWRLDEHDNGIANNLTDLAGPSRPVWRRVTAGWTFLLFGP